MFDIPITKEQKEYTWKLVKSCNFGNRGKFDGDLERQYTGILGQTVMADGLKEKRPDGTEGFDNGIDFVIMGKNVDLKTMGRTTEVRPSYVNNLVASQCKYATQFYVFSSINKKTNKITFIGVLPKKNLEKYFLKEGTERTRHDRTKFKIKTDMYEIPNKDLIQVRCWFDVVCAVDSR